MDCEHCTRKTAPEMVSRYAMEELAARQDIANRRSHIINIILVILLFASWIGFFVYESQFEEVTTTEEVQQEIDADGTAIVAGIGDAIYGEGQTDN